VVAHLMLQQAVGQQSHHVDRQYPLDAFVPAQV